jgi:hypothetical protein
MACRLPTAVVVAAVAALCGALSPALAAPQVFISPHGVDDPGCGGTLAAPCASLRYAVEVVGPVVAPGPLAPGPVEVVVGSGVYGAASCNTTAGVDLVVTGAGVGVSVFDCGSGARLLATNASLWVTDLTVQNTGLCGQRQRLVSSQWRRRDSGG